MFLVRCFLVWDCFSDGSEQVVVQEIIFQILSSAALREMTGPEGESAVMLFGIFKQLLKFCDALIIHSFNIFLIAPLVHGLSIFSTTL